MSYGGIWAESEQDFLYQAFKQIESANKREARAKKEVEKLKKTTPAGQLTELEKAKEEIKTLKLQIAKLRKNEMALSNKIEEIIFEQTAIVSKTTAIVTKTKADLVKSKNKVKELKGTIKEYEDKYDKGFFTYYKNPVIDDGTKQHPSADRFANIDIVVLEPSPEDQTKVAQTKPAKLTEETKTKKTTKPKSKAKKKTPAKTTIKKKELPTVVSRNQTAFHHDRGILRDGYYTRDFGYRAYRK